MAKVDVKDEADGRHDARLVHLTADVVSAYLSRNQMLVADIPGAIHKIHAELLSLKDGSAVAKSVAPAVSIKKSIGDDFIICLEDGKKLKMLRRHLRKRYNMTADQYRTKWGLPRDYPMVAPAYARARSAFAKKIGLGKLSSGTVRRAGKKRRVE